MAKITAPRIERAITKLYVPHGEKEIAFASPSFGPNTYQLVGQEILRKDLKVPTGDETASLLYPVYCNPQFKDEPEFQNIRGLMRSNWLWVFNQNLWTDKGVYVVQDLKAKGRSEPLNFKKLEKLVNTKGIKEVNGVRFSKDSRVRFAPKATYRLGEHTPQSLLEDGFIIASYDIEGAKKLGEISATLPNKPYTYGLEIAEANDPESRVSALSGDDGRLHVFGSNWSDYGRCHAFGVL